MLSRQLPRAVGRRARFPQRTLRQPIRYQSTASSSSSSSSNFAIGAVGGLVGASVAYGIYSFTPAGRTASKINKAAVEASKKYDAAAKTLQNNAPSADQAVDAIKQFAYSYAAWIPGGKGYVDTAFKDWETVRDSHKDEVDAIVNDTYKKLGEVSKSGLSLETASKAVDVLTEMSKRIAELSGEALSDILDNHPKVKEKFGGSVEQLQSMAKNYGPEAKKQVDQTWSQVKDIFAGGFSEDNLTKAKKLIEEKVQQIKQLGDEAWKKGMETAKPYLDKNPKIKEMIESNADALKQGNVSELFEKLRSTEKSGSLDDLQKYVQGTVDKAKSKASDVAEGSGLEKYFNMIPQGGEVMEKLQQIGQIAEKHKDEGEKLLKDTIEELKTVLEKKGKLAQEIASEAEKEAKREAHKEKTK